MILTDVMQDSQFSLTTSVKILPFYWHIYLLIISPSFIDYNKFKISKFKSVQQWIRRKLRLSSKSQMKWTSFGKFLQFYWLRKKCVISTLVYGRNAQILILIYTYCLLAYSQYSSSFLLKDTALAQDLLGGVLVSEKTLVLQQVSRAAAGSYTCKASNVEGDTNSNKVNVSIRCKCYRLTITWSLYLHNENYKCSIKIS